MSAKFGSLQGGRRVQCSSDSKDDIVLGEVAYPASTEWPQSGLGNSTTLSYIASEKNHDELRYLFAVILFYRAILEEAQVK